ncbi:MAG: CrcB family protein [Pseudomonadota bacterium]
MDPLLQVAIGGALGASVRYLTVLWTVHIWGAGFPWGVIAVNVVGCLLMGALVGALGTRFAGAPLILTGVLGGFTTFSAFSIDTLTLFENGTPVLALLYVGATVLASLAACALGFFVARGAIA